MKITYIAGIISMTCLATGCASIVSGTNQSLSVETRIKGVPVPNSSCKLSNDKGVWFVTTPGSVTVHRSYNDLSIRCEKEGINPGLLAAKSSTKGMAFGNILFGGLIGTGIDISTGAAYDYPTLLSIEMGETSTLAPMAPVSPQTEAVPTTKATN